ncbi:MAG TPA: hypothetical protein VI363_02745 [Burkholderiales bacterium]
MTVRDLPWAIRISRAQSCEALDGLMDVWFKAITAAGAVRKSVGFDSHMVRRDWQSAKGSLERTYGRSNPDHQQTMDTLTAAIHYRRVLGLRPAGSVA